MEVFFNNTNKTKTRKNNPKKRNKSSKNPF